LSGASKCSDPLTSGVRRQGPAEQSERLSGALLLEVHTFAAVRRIGEQPPGWTASASGLFAPTPHLCLSEHFWHADENAATSRYYVIDAASGAVSRYAQSFQAYTDEEYTSLLRDCGFAEISFFPALDGGPGEGQPELQVIVARP